VFEAHKAFHGYYFCMLKGQTDKTRSGAPAKWSKMVGGVSLVAYPLHRAIGRDHLHDHLDGVLLRGDSGKSTTETATAMSMFVPDVSWDVVWGRGSLLECHRYCSFW
jgi:hypothetical protein